MKADNLEGLFNGRGFHNPIEYYRMASSNMRTVSGDSGTETFISRSFEMSLISVAMGFYKDAANQLTEARKNRDHSLTDIKIYLGLLAGLIEMDLGDTESSGKLFREALETAINSRDMKLELLSRLHISLLLSYTHSENDYSLNLERMTEKQAPFTNTFDRYLSSWIRSRVLLQLDTGYDKIPAICREGLKELPADSFQYLHLTLVEAEAAFLSQNHERAMEKITEAEQHPFCSVYKQMNCYLHYLRGSYGDGSDKETRNDLEKALDLANTLPSVLWKNKIIKSLELWYSCRKQYREAYEYLKETQNFNLKNPFDWGHYLRQNNQEDTDSRNSLSYLRVINRAARALAGSSNYLELAEIIQSTSAGQLNFTLFALGIYNKHRRTIQYVYIQEDESLLKECELHLDRRGSLTSVCAESRQALLHNNTDSLPRGRNETPWRISEESSDPGSVIYIPIMTGSLLSGVMSFQNREKYAFKQSDIKFLTELSPFTGLALGRIEEKKQLEQERTEYRHFANHDYLTGLPNRNLLDSFLKRAIPRSAREKNNLAILFIDLDNFKQINDNEGHDTGDFVLCTVAERLTETLRQSDFATRAGGDEFIMALESFSDKNDIEKIGEKIIEIIRRPVMYRQKELCITCSMGISLYPDHGRTAEELIMKADRAMYQVKVTEKNGLTLYSEKNM